MQASTLAASGGSEAAFVVVVFVILLGSLLWALAGSQTRERNLGAAADRYNGRVAYDFLFGNRLEFGVDGIPAELTYRARRKNRSPYTRLRFGFTPPGPLRVVPEGFFASLRKAFGAEDLEFGDPAFDGAFVVQGSPVLWVREVLDEPTRQRIAQLAQRGATFWGGPNVTLEAGAAGVTLSCPQCFPDDLPQLFAFIDDGIALLRQLRVPAVEGIQIVSAEECVTRGDCPVCLTPLDDGARRCERCATPHHGDCWDYFGGCAVYACARREQR